MFVFDLTNILTLVLVLIATVLFIILSQEVKRGLVVAIPLFGFVLDLVVHTIQILTLSSELSYMFSTLCANMMLDFVFLLVTFLAYLWADEVEAQEFKKKSLKGGLGVLFKKV